MSILVLEERLSWAVPGIFNSFLKLEYNILWFKSPRFMIMIAGVNDANERECVVLCWSRRYN